MLGWSLYVFGFDWLLNANTKVYKISLWFTTLTWTLIALTNLFFTKIQFCGCLCNQQIYDNELEKMKTFEGFQDFVETFKLRRGKFKEGEYLEEAGEFKVNFYCGCLIFFIRELFNFAGYIQDLSTVGRLQGSITASRLQWNSVE